MRPGVPEHTVMFVRYNGVACILVVMQWEITAFLGSTRCCIGAPGGSTKIPILLLSSPWWYCTASGRLLTWLVEWRVSRFPDHFTASEMQRSENGARRKVTGETKDADADAEALHVI